MEYDEKIQKMKKEFLDELSAGKLMSLKSLINFISVKEMYKKKLEAAGEVSEIDFALLNKETMMFDLEANRHLISANDRTINQNYMVQEHLNENTDCWRLKEEITGYKQEIEILQEELQLKAKELSLARTRLKQMEHLIEEMT